MSLFTNKEQKAALLIQRNVIIPGQFFNYIKNIILLVKYWIIFVTGFEPLILYNLYI